MRFVSLLLLVFVAGFINAATYSTVRWLDHETHPGTSEGVKKFNRSPSPGLRDRVKSSQDFTFGHPPPQVGGRELPRSSPPLPRGDLEGSPLAPLGGEGSGVRGYSDPLHSQSFRGFTRVGVGHHTRDRIHKVQYLVIPSQAVLQSNTNHDQSWFQKARQHFEKQEWDQARQAAVRALELNPRLLDAELLLGLVATAQTNYGDAEKHFLKVVSIQPRNELAQGYLASTYFQQKRFDEASRAFQKLLQSNPANIVAHYNLGLIALMQEKPAQALLHFEKVHRANPSDVPALIGILESQLLLKRKSESHLSVQKLQRLLKPQDPRLFQVSTLLAVHQDYAAAIPIMEQVRQTFPQSYDVNYNLALAYFRSGNNDKAAEILQPLLNQPRGAEAYNLLATVEEERQRYLEAVRAFQKAAELDSGNEDYRFDYANELLQHRTNTEAIAVFASGVRDFPHSWKMRLGLGCASYLTGKYDEAAQSLMEAVKIQPKLKLAYLFLGKAYESAAASQPTIRGVFQSYLMQQPDDAWAYYHYGTMLYLAAQQEPEPDFRPAKSYLNLALALDPNFAEAHLQLGLIVQQEEQPEASISFLQRAIQSNPKLAAAHYRLGITYKRMGQAEKAKAEFHLYEKLKSEEASQERKEVIQFLVQQRRQN